MAPKSTKERSREWRECMRANPEPWEAYKQNEKGKYLRRKETGSRKLVKDMSDGEQRTQRKQWKRQKQNSRKGAKQYEAMTPWNSPPNVYDLNQVRINVGRKKVRKDRAKAYREINVLQVKLVHVNRRRK